MLRTRAPLVFRPASRRRRAGSTSLTMPGAYPRVCSSNALQGAGTVGRVPAAQPTALRRTPLHDRHVAAGARLVPFAGWEMPVQYEGIRAEHMAVREHAGIFDVSHMGELETSGAGAEALLQR